MPNENDSRPKKPNSISRLAARIAKLPTPDLDTSIQRIRLFAQEHFDDFVILARRKSVNGEQGVGLCWTVSDATWARGAMQRTLQELEICDSHNVQKGLDGDGAPR